MQAQSRTRAVLLSALLGVLFVAAPGCRTEANPCDAAVLDRAGAALTAAEAAWTPASGVEFNGGEPAAVAVWAACGTALPENFRRLLDALVEHPSRIAEVDGEASDPAMDGAVDAALPGHADVHREGGLVRDELTRELEPVCPGVESIAQRQGRLPGTKRAGALFEGCNLGARADVLVTRDEFVRLGATILAVRVVALAQWLTQHGVSPAQIRPIARALLRHTVGVFGSSRLVVDMPANARLPAAASGHGLDRFSVQCAVGPESIACNGKALLALDDGRIPAHLMLPDGVGVGPLFDTLAQEVDNAKAMHAGQGKGDPPELLLAVWDTPWAVVRSVIATANTAGFARVDAVVLVDDVWVPQRSVMLVDPSHPLSTLTLPDDATVQQVVSRALQRGGQAAAG